ncbi:MAG: hypothetical protein RR482_03335, partial [Clostridia bacterium]
GQKVGFHVKRLPIYACFQYNMHRGGRIEHTPDFLRFGVWQLMVAYPGEVIYTRRASKGSNMASGSRRTNANATKNAEDTPDEQEEAL